MKVSIDTKTGEDKLAVEIHTRIESELEVKSYLQDLKYAIEHGAQISFQVRRLVDEKRDEKYTNQYTVSALFPDENPVEALKRELKSLTGNVFPFRRKGIYAENVPI